MDKKRSNFSGKLGFVLAAAGSAVGLGNLWRFPYLAAKYGGGIFLLVYLILVVSFGFALTIAEIAIGRKSNLSVIGAFKKLSEKYSFIGYLAALVPIIIMPYYCVIGGWVVKYLAMFLFGNGSLAAQDGFFASFTSSSVEPIVMFLIFLVITAIVVYRGVEKGIEKVSKVLMPILAVLTVCIALYSISLPGSFEGLMFYLKPDFSKFSLTTIVGAMGQLFYSMSLAMGIMVTYGSYMKKDVDLEQSVTQIELFDTGMAFFAGMMIIPAVFAFSGGDPNAINAGPGLMFMTLPKVFDAMPFGHFIGTAFFVLVLFAALTSSISLLETIVSIFCDKFHWKRHSTTIVVLIYTFVMSIPSTLGFGVWSHITPLGMDFLTFFDFISNSILMPIVAFLECIFIGYILKPNSLIEEIKISSKFKREKLFTVVIKYVAPVCLIIILISSVLSGFGIITI